MQPKNLALFFLFVTAIIWGITLPLMKVNLLTIPPLTLAFLRFSLAATIALSFDGFRKLKLKDFFHIGIFSFFGISLHIGFLVVGLEITNAIDATLILTLSPIITSIFAAFFLRERIGPLHSLGILLTFLGVSSYLVLPELFSQNLNSFNLIGDLLILGSVLSAVIFTLGSKKLFNLYPPKAVSSVSFLVGALSFLPFAFSEYLFNPIWINNISWFNIFSILFLGIFSSYLAYNALEWGLSKLDVHIDVTIGYLSSMLAVLIATVFLHEKLHLSFFIFSIVLVGIGIALVTRHKASSLHFHHRISHHA